MEARSRQIDSRISTPARERALFRRKERRALEVLGDFRDRVEALIDRTNRFNWLASGGLPVSEADSVLQLSSLTDALRWHRQNLQVGSAVRTCLANAAKYVGRDRQVLAAGDLFIARSLHYENDEALEISLAVVGDITGALSEVILQDVVPIDFFGRSIDWYERGHWLCGIGRDGKPVIW
jgi:hypothetical protein